MRIIEVTVNGCCLTRDSQNAGVQGEANASALRIGFDPGWDGLVKTLTWWNAKGENEVKRILTAEPGEDTPDGGRVYLAPIPGEALTEPGKCRFAIDGYIAGKRMRSVYSELVVKPAGGYRQDAANDPSPTLAEQLQAQIDALAERQEAASHYPPRAYTEGMKLWKVCHVPAADGGEYFVAGRTRTQRELAIDTVTKPRDTAKTVLQYMPAPFPVSGCHVTATCDRLGQYVSSVNSLYGDATVAFSYRVVDPSNPTDHISTSVRFLMAGPRKKPGAAPKRAYDKAVGDEIVAIAQSYVDAAESGRGFAYGENFFYLNGRPINNADGEGMMECDTFAGLVLRGIRYGDSPYADDTPGLEFPYDRMMANCTHSGSAWCSDLRAQIAGEEANSVHGRDIRFAADLAWLAWRSKGSVFSDIANAMPGDLCFWRNPRKKNYFDNITHVAILGEDGDIYEVGDSVNGSVLHRMKLSDRSQPEYFARLYGEYQDTGDDGDIGDDIVDDSGEDPAADKDEAADDTPTMQDRLEELEKQLADLLYTPISVSSFTHNVGTKERGETVTEVTLSWTLNKEPVSLQLDGESLEVSARSKTVSGLSITAANANDVKWTLTATDERGKTVTKTTPAVTFLNCVYCGAAEQPDTIDSDFILSLGTKTAPTNTRARSITVSGGGAYIWYCLPTGLGKCAFTSNGFPAGIELVDTVAFTNALDYTENYYVYRSNQRITDTVTIGVS